MAANLLAQTDGSTRVSTLVRPARLYALDAALGPAIADALGEAAADAIIRAVVFTGATRWPAPHKPGEQ